MNIVACRDREQSLNAMWRAYLAVTVLTDPNNTEKSPAIVGHAFLNARYYDSQRGQFLSEDPVFLAIGTSRASQLGNQDMSAILSNPQQLNSYSYSHGNPINAKDPQGLLGPDTPVEAAFATPSGFILGAASQAAKDWQAGHLSPIEDYWGSEVGGAATLNMALDSDGFGIPISAGVGGAAGDATTQLLKNIDGSKGGFNVGSVITEGGYSMAFSGIFDLGISSVLARYASPVVTPAVKYTFNTLGGTLRAASAVISSQVAKGLPSSVSQGAFEGNGSLSGLKQTLLNIQSILNSYSAPASTKSKSH